MFEEYNIGMTCTGTQTGTIIGCWKGTYEVRYLVSMRNDQSGLDTLTKKWIDRWRADTDADNATIGHKSNLIILSEKELNPYMDKRFAWVDAKRVTIDSRIKTLEEILSDIEDDTN